MWNKFEGRDLPNGEFFGILELLGFSRQDQSHLGLKPLVYQKWKFHLENLNQENKSVVVETGYGWKIGKASKLIAVRWLFRFSTIRNPSQLTKSLTFEIIKTSATTGLSIEFLMKKQMQLVTEKKNWNSRWIKTNGSICRIPTIRIFFKKNTNWFPNWVLQHT